MTAETIFTSESVTEGHPDKLCDLISDACVDAVLREDPQARIAAECAIAAGVVFLAVRLASEASFDFAGIARRAIGAVGYDKGSFDARKCSILVQLQDLPASQRLVLADDAPASEQVNAFGYASAETPALMPLPATLAHLIARRLDEARRGPLPWLSPDGKTQAAIRYRDGLPVDVASLAISVGVLESAPQKDEARAALLDLLHLAAGEAGVAIDERTMLAINVDTDGAVGGPARHAGLTGRKTGIDSYGEIARHSGAALSGKDPSRIDRIGAYALRQAAASLVASGLVARCEVHAAYAIGRAEPLDLSVDSFGTGVADDAELARRLRAALDFRPGAIARRLGLCGLPQARGEDGFYRRLATYGHFGRRDVDAPWEVTVPLG